MNVHAYLAFHFTGISCQDIPFPNNRYDKNPVLLQVSHACFPVLGLPAVKTVKTAKFPVGFELNSCPISFIETECEGPSTESPTIKVALEVLNQMETIDVKFLSLPGAKMENNKVDAPEGNLFFGYTGKVSVEKDTVSPLEAGKLYTLHCRVHLAENQSFVFSASLMGTPEETTTKCYALFKSTLARSMAIVLFSEARLISGKFEKVGAFTVGIRAKIKKLNARLTKN